MTRTLRWPVVILVALVAGCTASRERERVDFERMRIQQRYGLYGASRVFSNGQSMQQPPAGTVSREAAAQMLSTGIDEADSASTVSVTTIPLPVTPALLDRGRNRFAIYCAVCHGAGGFGGSLVAANMGQPRPPSLRTAMMRTHPVGYIFGVATHGKGRMPPYAPQLTPDDRWAIVAYIRQLQATGALTPDERADSLRAQQLRTIDSIAAAERPR